MSKNKRASNSRAVGQTIPNQQIKGTADSFNIARAILLEEAQRRMKSSGNGIGSEGIINNAIVAVELYLKSLCSEDHWTPVNDGSAMNKVTAAPSLPNHSLPGQLTVMPEPVRYGLEQAFCASQYFAGLDLEKTLAAFDGVFAWSRYPFHIACPKDFDFMILMQLAEFLGDYVGKMAPTVSRY